MNSTDTSAAPDADLSPISEQISDHQFRWARRSSSPAVMETANGAVTDHAIPTVAP